MLYRKRLISAVIFFTVIYFFVTATSSFSVSAADSAGSGNIKNKNMILSKSPVGATVRSLILPGWGQFYVQKYWKVPIFLGAAGVCTYIIIDNNNSYKDKKDQINATVANDPNDPYIELYKRQREVYRDNRDQAIFCLAGVYLLSAIDAYVDAHLFDFNVNDNMTLNLGTGGIDFARVKFTLKF